MKKLISIALAASSLLLVYGSQAWAWDDGDWGRDDRWHRYPHQHHSSFVLVYGDHWPVYRQPVYYQSVYYQPVQVIPAPVSDTVVINILNDNGSYTPVSLRRVGGVYVGPRGEQYLNLPTIDQLKPVYGLK